MSVSSQSLFVLYLFVLCLTSFQLHVFSLPGILCVSQSAPRFALPNEVPRKLRGEPSDAVTPETKVTPSSTPGTTWPGSVAESCGVELEEVKSQTAKEVDLEQELHQVASSCIKLHLIHL